MIIVNPHNWLVKDISEAADYLKSKGIDGVQFSPITYCKEASSETNASKEWWKLYQPYSFKRLENRLGNENQVRAAVENLHKNGIKAFTDSVVRHVAGEDRPVQPGCLPQPHPNVDKELLQYLAKQDYTNVNSRYDIIHGCWGMPRLDYNNKNLQEQVYIPHFDKLLYDIGFDGVRLDMGKHFALPNEGGTFWTNVIGRYTEKFIYAECINTPTYLLNEYTKYCKVLTDQYAQMGTGSVRFFESHDTYWHPEWSDTRNLNTDQRIKLFEELVNKYNNVMLFLRPYDDILNHPRFTEIATNRNSKAKQNIG